MNLVHEYLVSIKYKFGEYLLQTFPVYNELMTIYLPQEKTTNKSV